MEGEELGEAPLVVAHFSAFNHLRVWRCRHRCRPPPRIDEEHHYELVGDAGRKNGACPLRTCVCWMARRQRRVRVGSAHATPCGAVAASVMSAAPSGVGESESEASLNTGGISRLIPPPRPQ